VASKTKKPRHIRDAPWHQYSIFSTLFQAEQQKIPSRHIRRDAGITTPSTFLLITSGSFSSLKAPLFHHDYSPGINPGALFQFRHIKFTTFFLIGQAKKRKPFTHRRELSKCKRNEDKLYLYVATYRCVCVVIVNALVVLSLY
jgi:hypothetical protein